MKHLRIVLTTIAVLLVSALLHAQSCDSLVIDEAGIIKTPALVESGAKALIDQGADVHVVTVDMTKYGPRLDSAEAAIESRCASWRSPAGGRKANLFVVMVAPNQRKKNVFFGSAYTGALRSEDAVNTLYSKYANPFFAAKQWEGGFKATLGGFSAKIAAYHDEQQHPVQSSTTVQPVNLKPVANVFLWFIGLLAALLAGWGIFFFIRNRRKDEEESGQAQGDAINAWTKATQRFRRLSRDTPHYDEWSSTFSDLSSSLSLDPNEPGKSTSTYRSIEKTWQQFYDSMVVDSFSSNAREERHASTSSRVKNNRRAYEPTPPPMYPMPSSNTTVVVVDTDRQAYRAPDPEPTRYEPPPDPPSYSSGSSSGSDSSWGSSSDSSSSFGSGSDSGFSSDSGGGGGGSDSSF